MARAVERLDQAPRVAEVVTGADGTKVERLNLERFAGWDRLPLSEAEAEGFVNHLFEGLAGAASLSAQTGCNVVVEGECGTHITMLRGAHQDVDLSDMLATDPSARRSPATTIATSAIAKLRTSTRNRPSAA